LLAAEEAVMMMHALLCNHSSRVYGISPEPSPFLDTRLAIQELLWE
jgi:hypothetical protein